MKSNIALKHRSIKGITAVTLLFLFLTGCAATNAKPKALSLECKPQKMVQLSFKRHIQVTPPKKNPVTAEEHIRCGLFYFNREKFIAAGGEFEKAKKKISGRQNSLYRACLMSAAVCNLLADNKPVFLKAIKELKTNYSRYELMIIEGKDDRVKTLLALYNKLMKTCNF